METTGDSPLTREQIERWTHDELVNWARQVLAFDDEDIAVLEKAKMRPQDLFLIPSVQALTDVYRFAAAPAIRLWTKIEPMIVRQENKTYLADIQELRAELIKLKLRGSSSSEVLQNAMNLTYIVDIERCFKDVVRETSTEHVVFKPQKEKNEEGFRQRLMEHFSHGTLKLCLADTHKTAPIGMSKKPDAIIVRQEAKQYKSAVSIVGVVELKKENQLREARGQVIKDIMELVDIQTSRTNFIGVFGDQKTVGFLRIEKIKHTFSFYQSPVMAWEEGSTWVWRLLETEPLQLGFIPPVTLELGTKGMTLKSCHATLKRNEVLVYKILDPLYNGTEVKRCVVAPCYIEDASHSTLEARRSKDNPLVVVIKYSTCTKSHAEVDREVEALSKFQAVHKHVNIRENEALLFPIPILLGSGSTPKEKYPCLLTYPLGKSVSFDQSHFIAFAEELNLALVLAHTKANLFHGDVSPKNIVMHCNKPVLIDWAYSIPKQKSKLLGFTGTMTFASIAVTHLRDQLDDYEYRARDDFESLFYTLLYLASGNSLPWSKKRNLSASELADAKRIAVTQHWNATRPLVGNPQFWDALQAKLFTNELEDVESLFDNVTAELKKRMDTLK